MAASLAAASLLFAGRLLPAIPRGWSRGLNVAVWSFVPIIIIASNNRNAAVGIPVVVLFPLWLDRRRKATGKDGCTEPGSWRRVAVIGIVAIGLLSSLAVLEFGARQRLQMFGMQVADDQSALVTLTERDTRPMIWAYYEKLATRAPWIGVGFGRTVPGLTYHTQDDQQLARMEANAYIHAHNLFLNWWRQTGVVGVLLLIALLAVILNCIWGARDEPDTRRRAAAITAIAIVSIMLVRNTTDDFLMYGMATMFWALVGAFTAAALAPGLESQQPLQRAP